jgi:hypothetical protein
VTGWFSLHLQSPPPWTFSAPLPPRLGQIAIVTAYRVWSHAAWMELIRFTTPVFLAIRPSPKTVTVSSRGRTIVGT